MYYSSYGGSCRNWLGIIPQMVEGTVMVLSPNTEVDMSLVI